MPTPTNICVDLNIIVDLLLARQGGAAAKQLIDKAVSGQVNLYISAHCITTLANLLGRAGKSNQEIRLALAAVIDKCTVVPTAKTILLTALASSINDYEDALVEQAALKAGCELIITRNTADYQASRVPAMAPELFLAPQPLA